MNWFTTGIEERQDTEIILANGKAELLRKECAYYVFYNGSPLNYYYDYDKALNHYNCIKNM